MFTTDISATVVVGNDGTVHVTFEATTGSGDAVAFAVSHNGGTTFTTRLIAPVNDIPSPLPGATFRDNSFPALALDGSTLHVVWSNWNGSDADVVYMRSTNGGTTWSAPIAIGGGPGDQFFPWIAARNGTVYASWFNRASGDTYAIAGAAQDRLSADVPGARRSCLGVPRRPGEGCWAVGAPARERGAWPPGQPGLVGPG